jgi:hypothetical protein
MLNEAGAKFKFKPLSLWVFNFKSLPATKPPREAFFILGDTDIILRLTKDGCMLLYSTCFCRFYTLFCILLANCAVLHQQDTSFSYFFRTTKPLEPYLHPPQYNYLNYSAATSPDSRRVSYRLVSSFLLCNICRD